MPPAFDCQALPRRAQGSGFWLSDRIYILGAHWVDQQPQAVLAELHQDHVRPHGRDELSDAVAGRARHMRRTQYVYRCPAA